MKKHFKKFGSEYFEGIAHRGLHNKEFTENGLNAFKNAIEHDLAFELDVHLSKDGELIVCHDGELKRTTGKEGRIEELTAKEIREQYRLLDGGVVPTFAEVLALNDGRKMIVVELKVENKNHRALGKAVRTFFKNLQYDGKKFVFISFDPRALRYVKHLGIPTALLVEPGHKWTFSFVHMFDSVDIEHSMLRIPKVARYAKKHVVNTWTIRDETLFEEVINVADTVTFEHFDYEVVKEKLKSKKALQK